MIEELKAEFYRGIEGKGCDCPVCGRFAKIYAYPMNAGMARTLIWLWKRRSDVWIHLPSTAPRYVLASNSVGKLLYWNFVERRPNVDDPTKKMTGWYRITPKGRAFVEGRITAKSHVLVFDETVFGWRDERVSIHRALGKRFNYQELMEDTPP